MKIWRITKERFAKQAFSGEGAGKYGGRWNSVGTRVVYCSGTKALAALEILARVDFGTLVGFVSIEVEFDEELIEPTPSLPHNWKVQPPGYDTQKIGDNWVRRKRSVALAVPSVIIDSETNYLLNPAHADCRRLAIGAPEAFPLDRRLPKS